jgi:lipopolysaccharide export system permease protein
LATVTGTHTIPHPRSLALRLPILDAYLLREMVGPFLFAFAAYLIFWALNIFFIAADYIINYHAPIFLTLRFVLFRVPQAVPMAFPFACLFAALLAMGRLMGDNEVTAMRTSGVPLWRFAFTPLVFGAVMFGVAYFTNEYVSPWSIDQSTRSFYQIVYNTESLPVEQQFFRKDPDSGRVFYVSQVATDGKTMVGVQIFNPGKSGYWNETFQAKTATVDGATLVLHDIVHTRFAADGNVAAVNKDKEIRVGLPLGETAAQFMSNVNSDPWTMSSKSLATQVKTLEAQGIGGSTLGNLQINLADKIAWPFSCLIGVLIALPLALLFGKRGRTLGAAMAVFAFFVYFLMTSAASALGRNGAMNPYLAAWIPNIIMGGVGVVLLWLEEH